MSNITKYHFFGAALPLPEVKILQFNYLELDSWVHRNVSAQFWYLWINEQPGAFLTHKGKSITIPVNTMLLIPPHTTLSTGNHHKRFFQFYLHFSSESRSLHVRNEPIFLDLDALDFMSEFKKNATNHESLGLLLYSIACRALLAIPQAYLLTPEEAKRDERIEYAILTMNCRLQEKFISRFICKNLSMSMNNFIRLFKKEMGIPPHHYRLMRQIEFSKNLLLHADFSIDEIAQQVGFTDRYHFSKTFKRFTDTTPVAYRKQHLNKNS